MIPKNPNTPSHTRKAGINKYQTPRDEPYFDFFEADEYDTTEHEAIEDVLSGRY